MLHDIGQRPAGLQSIHLHAVGDVVEDRLGERIGPLKHHAHAAAQLGDVQLQHVLAVQQHLAFVARALDGLVDAVQRAQEGGLAAAGRADQRGDALLGNFQADIVQRLKGAVEEVQIRRPAVWVLAATSGCTPEGAAGGAVISLILADSGVAPIILGYYPL